MQGLEKVVWGFTVRGSWRSNITALFWPLNLMAVTLCLSCSFGAHSAGWSATFYQQLLRSPNSIGVPEGPFSWVWLSLPQIFSNWPGTPTQLARRTQLSYIIVWPPLDLWNRMFNRHQAEITVMQFRGYSLPVHHSVMAQWDLHLAPYYQP